MSIKIGDHRAPSAYEIWARSSKCWLVIPRRRTYVHPSIWQERQLEIYKACFSWDAPNLPPPTPCCVKEWVILGCQGKPQYTMSYLASLPHPTGRRFQSTRVFDKSLLTWINPNLESWYSSWNGKSICVMCIQKARIRISAWTWT